MPTLRDREGVWHADLYYFDEGTGQRKRAQRSTGIKNDGTRQSERTAERVARDLEASLVDGRGRKARDCTLEKAFELRVAERELAGAARASLQIIAEKGANVTAFFGKARDVATIDADALKLYAQAARRGSDERKGRAPGTVMREITELRCAMRAAGVEPPKAPDLGVTYSPRELWFDSEASAKMIAALPASRRDHAIVHRLAGLRYSELYKLEAKDLSAKTIRVRGTKTVGSDRTLPMHPEVEAILRRRATAHPVGPLFPDRWLATNGNRDMDAAAKRAGLQYEGKVSFNVLRASFCTELVLAGVPLKKIAYLMGHKTTHMIERVYTRFFGSEVGLDLGDALGSLRHTSATNPVDD